MLNSVGPRNDGADLIDGERSSPGHGACDPVGLRRIDTAQVRQLHINDAPVLDPVYRILNYRQESDVLVVGMECIPTPRVCPYCKSEIDMAATRCPHCTSVLEDEKAE